MAFPDICICSGGSIAGVVVVYWLLWRYRYFPDVERSFISWLKDRFKR